MGKDYEAMIILSKTADEAAKKIQEAVEKLFKEVGAEVKNLQIWGKRALGYKIKGRTEGYYLLYELNLDPNKAVTLQAKLDLSDDVVRCLLTVKEKSGEVKK
jgi:small subunit ribosomal protein S6